MYFVYKVVKKEGRLLLFFSLSHSLSDYSLDCAGPKEISVVNWVLVLTYGRAEVVVALVLVRSGPALLLCCITCFGEVRVYSSAPVLFEEIPL